MNVSLTPDLTRFVEEKVRSGCFPSQSEVIRAGLRLLQQRDQLYGSRLDRLRNEVAVGLEQARRGELLPGEAVFAELEERSRARRNQRS